MDSISGLIDDFFEDPYVYRGITGRFSVLYLLRRDILTCFGLNPNNNEPTEFMALWPGAMGVLAGIDLLGKFFAGDDSIGKVGDRFKKFITHNFDSVSPRDGEIIYQFRNSMLHSFGLYSKSKNREFRFSLTQTGNNALVTKIKADNYRIDIFTLHEAFEKAIIEYENCLRKQTDLQVKFRSMVENYGFIQIQGER